MPPQKLPKFQMPFEPMTIEHLGLRLYSTLPPVISELVSNAHDAESPEVLVTFPSVQIDSSSEVIVRDFGHGMTPKEMNAEFLPIGRNRRLGANGSMSKRGKVRVTGRKGLGKLSSFGVAEEMEVRSICNGFGICLRIKYQDMINWAEKHPGQPYEPKVVTSRTGKTTDSDGVEVTLRGLHRKRPISEQAVRRGLARRLNFIGSKFKVKINGKSIGPGDRLSRKECMPGYSWGLDKTPVGTEVKHGEFSVSGWVGFLPESSQTGRGVDIFANRKAVELESFFNFSSTHIQLGRAHLVGEVHADILDGDKDLIATARNQVVWESEIGELLESWGQRLMKWALSEWLRLRRGEKEKTIITASGFDKWLATRPKTEQRVADRMVKLLVKDDGLAPESMAPILNIVKSSVETVAFHELVDTIEQEGTNASTLLLLFDEWRIIEAREHLKLADGRLATIEQLERFIEEGALEVQDLQPLFEENTWLIDSAWTKANFQPTYTKLLREKCKQPKNLPEEDRRLDILGITASGVLTVVELKRPEKTVSRDDLEQIERYVDWAESNIIGTGPDAPTYAKGLLVVGKQSSIKEVGLKVKRLRGDDIRVETYRDIHAQSRHYYNELEKRLETIAPEYTRKRRRRKN